MTALTSSDFNWPGQNRVYHGKVRDVYFMGDEQLIMVASDRISAFDVVLPAGIPHKGQVLNQIAAFFLEMTSDIVPNWMRACPDPQVMAGVACKPYRVEMVIRAYLTGHAWREYRDGKRELCGVPLPEGLNEHDRLPTPIITPATKAEEGHDEDISREEIIRQGIVPEVEYSKLEAFTRALFARGTTFAKERGLILVDTKYEFGKRGDEIFLIDEIHTPDSSRYFYAEGYEDRQAHGEQQRQLSKEFVRQWLISEGFQGREGEQVPVMDNERVEAISARYIELYENITGKTFHAAGTDNIAARIDANVRKYIGS